MPDIFEAGRLGPVELRNRVIKAATFEGRTPKGLVTDDLIAFHRTMAAGGVAMTTVAYCAVSPEGRTDRHQIHMRPEAMPGLRALTDVVHAEGAAVSAQLGHAGPVADARSNKLPTLAPTRRLSPLTGQFMRAVGEDDIKRLIDAHAEAAVTAADCGFDAVELHFGHNYLISSFLSPKFNRRRDRWGGELENRARFAREVARAAKERVGDRVAVIAKLNMEDGVRGGLQVEEGVEVGRMLERDGHLDALELTVGSSLANPMYYFRGEAPVREMAKVFPQPLRTGIRLVGHKFFRTYPYRPAYLLDEARRFREALSMPLILLGGITDRSGMDLAMAEGFEFVAMGRALLMEPDLVNRIAADPATTSQCVHCNKCMPTIYQGTRCVLTQDMFPAAAAAPDRA